MAADELTQQSLSHVFWGHTKTKAQVRIQSYYFIVLFLIGVVFWIGFLGKGNLSLTAYDWTKEAGYLNTLRLAQVNGVIPWRWSEAFFQDTDRFLANPEVVLTPDIFLLRWISNSNFIVFHVILFYSIGFWGSVLLTKRLKASFIAFSFFWLLFNFNGYITSRIAIGHFQWTGYFVLPFFFMILFRFGEATQNAPSFHIAPVLSMALLFGVLFLNGSIHIAIWLSMFLILALSLRRSMYLNVLASLLLGFLLGFGRLLPAFLWFHPKSSVLSGYPTFGSLIDALTSLHFHNFTGIQDFVGLVGWWEYDIYVGFAAFAILAISIFVALKRNTIPDQSYLLGVVLFFLLLSLGNVHAVIAVLPLPFAGLERLPSRFVVMPLVFFLIVAMTGIDELVRSWGKRAKLLLLLGLPIVVNELFHHFGYWRVRTIEESFQNVTSPVISLTACTDQRYMMVVYASWTISFISLILAAILLFRVRGVEHNARSTKV